MERAPNVSAALARRITQHLDNDVQPSIIVRQVKLRDVVLIRANGTEAPAAEEVRRQAAERNRAIDVTFWNQNRATAREGNRVFGYDISGNRHLMIQRRGGRQVVTAQGRRFYNEMPKTSWIIGLPVIFRRTRPNGRVSYFKPHTLQLTDEMMSVYFEPGSREHELLLHSRTIGADDQGQLARMMSKWAEEFPPGKVIPNAWQYVHEDPHVVAVVDNERITYSAQSTGIRNGERTIDTFLDQVVFGDPVTGFDLWQKMHLHEVSRRRNQECGIDVIVASATIRPCFQSGVRNMVTAEEAAQTLVTLAKAQFPDSALAQYDTWKKAAVPNHTTKTAQMYRDLKNRDIDREFLRPYVDKMATFLRKSKTLEEIMTAVNKGNIFRQTAKQKKMEPPLPAMGFMKALHHVFTWIKRDRVLAFLCLFPEFVPLWNEDSFVSRVGEVDTVEYANDAREAVKACGTPVRLLLLYYIKLQVRVVILQGSACRYVHTPPNWEETQKITVVLNVWSNHVFTYSREVANHVPLIVKTPRHVDRLIAKANLEDRKIPYSEMLPLTWDTFKTALEDKTPKSFYTSENINTRFLEIIDQYQVPYRPQWRSHSECRAVTVDFGDKRKHGVYIKQLPSNHEMLNAFCEAVQDQGIKLVYYGETDGVLAFNLMQLYAVRKRRPISEEDTATLKERQKNRCDKCGDMLRRFEKHHVKPVAAGGSDSIDNLVLLCPPCHAQETEKQEQSGMGRQSVWFESRLSPVMHNAFVSTPLPKQIHWGNTELKNNVSQDQTVGCLDVVGCRSNFFRERVRDIPVGCPLDEFEIVFDEDDNLMRPLTDFEWFWVDVYNQGDAEGFQDAPQLHRLYDGPHLYPLDTVLFLIDDGFLEMNSKTFPIGWAPLHRRPANILASSFEKIKAAWDDVSDEYFETETRKAVCKRMILALIGVWSTQHRQSLKCYRTDADEDCPAKDVHFSYVDNTKLTFATTDIIDNCSMLPFALQCRFHEALLMERAMRIIEKLPSIVPVAARVDGIYFAAADTHALMELEVAALKERYPISEMPVYQIKDCDIKDAPHNPQSWNYQEVMNPHPFENKCSDDEYFEKYYVQKKGLWDEHTDEQEKAVRMILDAGGGLVTGAAGTGKSRVIHTLYDELVKRGERVFKCAYTHAAAKLIGGSTVAHLLHLDRSLHDAWILVDEYSLIPIDTLGQLARHQLVGAKFAIFGDHEGQFEPMRDRWDAPYSMVAESELLSCMCAYRHFRLTQYRRGEDQKLFDFYTSLYTRADHEIDVLVNNALSIYKARLPNIFDYYLILCVSHANRILCNARQNAMKAQCAQGQGKDTWEIEWEGDLVKGATSQPQTMIIWEGIELIGAPRGSGITTGIVQGVIYTVISCNEEEVILRMRPEYNADEKEITLNMGDVPILTRLTHAMCYYTCQGRSIDRGQTVLMLDIAHSYFSRRALIVGMSRVRHGDDLHIADENMQTALIGRNHKKFRK